MTPREANPLERSVTELQAAVLDCLERGGAVVTGNARAARSLRRLYALKQQARGRQAWSTPLIHDWESWLSILWQQYLQNTSEAPLLLTPLQERSVWKKIAGAAEKSPNAIAELAQKAWKLLGDFSVHDERSRSWSSAAGSDAEVFRGWASIFDRRCRTNRWLSRGGLVSFLTKSIRQGAIELPREICLVGFDRITPAQQEMIDSVRTAGAVIRELESPKDTGSPQIVQAKDFRDELLACAWWLRRRLEENPSITAAVVVQGIEEARGEIDRVFRAILMPQSTGIESGKAMPYEFSLGVPLATVPLVRSALFALRWLVEPLDQPVMSWLITSGFFASDGEDQLKMAHFDVEVRRRGHLPPNISINGFLRCGPLLDSRTVRQFCNRLARFQQEASNQGAVTRRRAFHEWTAVAEDLLKSLHWPGARALESLEFQASLRWERLLGEIAVLSFDGALVSWGEFVTALERYASETIFAPESVNAPIQIMGALESAGQEFDALWFLCADDRHWPAAGQPNPLLPVWLQRKSGMPHASVAGDWPLYLAVTQRVASSAAECIFSYALRNETGELRSSALLTEAFGSSLSLRSSEQLRTALHVPPALPHRRRTERIDDASSVPWPIEIHAGGADVLKRQSACAFQSFAVRRLSAQELDIPERGLTPLDRGNLVHDVMNDFWSKPNPSGVSLQSRSDLFNANASGLLPVILDFHIAEAFRKRETAGQGGGWSKAYLQVEQERLHSLLLLWLNYELTRTDFTVEACERKSEAEVNGLKLALRVDRIDQVDGGRLILDYKTGAVSPAAWGTERPEEPQLPLYATHGQIDDLRGVLFAQIRAGKTLFKGCVEDATKTVATTLEKRQELVKSPLTAIIREEWSAALGNLTNQFLAGDAVVEPRSYPRTCEYCPLSVLCRVAETMVPIEAPDEEDWGVDDESTDG